MLAQALPSTLLDLAIASAKHPVQVKIESAFTHGTDDADRPYAFCAISISGVSGVHRAYAADLSALPAVGSEVVALAYRSKDGARCRFTV